MSDLAHVMQRIDAGDKVRCYEDFYGRQWIELRRGWLLPRKVRYDLTNDQMMAVREALSLRRQQRANHPGESDRPQAVH